MNRCAVCIRRTLSEVVDPSQRPAGYGKTMLLAQWLQAGDAGLSVAWISLDEQDNDPVRLWRHIVEALHLAAPEEDFGADVLAGMSVTRRRLIETSLRMVINGLAELPREVVLVFDVTSCCVSVHPSALVSPS
jgi:LuxR family transcriptional regulator, maltose regulon positive regulatory protein